MERYSDRMMRPGDAPTRVDFVREGNRLIPIPVGSAAVVPKRQDPDEAQR